MASHGAIKEQAATMPPSPKKMPKVLEHIQLMPAENGGVAAEHRFTHYEHKPEMHVFGANEGGKLMAHLQHHLGIKMPGRAEGTVASPASGEVKENDD